MDQEKIRAIDEQAEAAAAGPLEKTGEVKIADEVVAMIAAFAAMEVEGVASLAGNTTTEILNKMGRKRLGGVRVEVEDGAVRANISVVLKYGFNIPATSSNIQTRVKQAVESMTGLAVTDVNVRIVGISMEGEQGGR